MATTVTAVISPKSKASTDRLRSAPSHADHPCRHCGEWPDRHICGYCLPCHAQRMLVWRRRRRRARLSRWFSEAGNSDATRAAMLTSAIVDELGGYDRAAAQIVAWLRESVESGRAPRESLKAIQTLLKLIELSAPVDAAPVKTRARKKPTRVKG